MLSTGSSLINQVLSLPVAERAELADRLLQSLNSKIAPEVEAAWAAEAEVRRDAVLSGKSPVISGPSVPT